MPEGCVRISSEPLIRAIHRHLVQMVFVAYVALLVYLSLVPFDFILHRPSQVAGRFFLNLQVANPNLPDIFANIGLYLPAGALGFLVCRRLKLGWLGSGCCAVLFFGLLSLAIENGQNFLASRVSSWVDVATNVLGTVIGATLTGIWHAELKRLVLKGRASRGRNWWLTVSKAAVCGLLVIHLRPFDVAVDIYHTAASVRHADVSPLATWHGLEGKVAQEIRQGRRSGMHELPRVQWEYAIDRAVDTAAYAGLTLLLAFGLAPQFRCRRRMFAWIGFIVLSLAMMVSVIRIFLISHGLDTAHVCCGAAGWLIGIVIALRVSHVPGYWYGLGATGGLPARADTGSKLPVAPVKQTIPVDVPGSLPARKQGAPAPRRLPRGLMVASIAGVMVVAVLYELVPFDFAGDNGAQSAASHAFWKMPFARHLLSRPNDALYDISGDLLRYGAIGVCLAFMLQRWNRRPWRRQLAVNVLITGAICFALEAVHLFMASRSADVTTVILALIASFAGAVGVRWMIDYRAYLSVVVRDDVLTRQLIEGESYEENGEWRVENSELRIAKSERKTNRSVAR